MIRIILKTVFICILAASPVFAEEFSEKAIEISKKGVVSIKGRSNHSAYDFSGEYFGTGFLVDKKQGIIATNRHIVKPGTVVNYEVKFFNGHEIEASLIYYDPWQDFAFIKVNPAELYEEVAELKLADKEAFLNQSVFMIGNNQGQDFSMQTGRISSLYEQSGSFPTQSLRISLNAKGGSSGSPVFNKSGDVIAINHSGDDVSAIALPSKYLIDSLKYIKEGAQPKRFHFGAITDFYSIDKAIKYDNFPREKAKGYASKYVSSFNKTLRVEFVLHDSPAEGKIFPGDIIWEVNGQEIGPRLYLLDKIMNETTDKVIKLGIIRHGKFITIDMPLYDLHAYSIKKIVQFGGAYFYEFDDFKRTTLGAESENRVFVTNIKPGSSFYDRFPPIPIDNTDKLAINILELNHMPVKNLDDLIKLIPELIKKKHFTVTYANYATSWLSYSYLYYFNRSPSISEVTYDPMDNEPVIYNFDPKQFKWITEAIKF
jgi:S1-C subfamily serine protease